MKKISSAQEPKGVLKILFLTLFLDLVGFSIIFPLFPELIQYYLKVDGDNIFLHAILGLAQNLSHDSSQITVLFGGILAALYSFFQFLFSPFWGRLSDRIGRKPVLILSILGLCASYLLWVFAHSFTLLILGRLIGGIMAGNISTVTASVGDITSDKNRSRGMAIIGIAFGLGFILGPAIGGICSLVKLNEFWPGVAGLNPFSFAAFVAFFLCFVNLLSVLMRFPETLPPEKRGLQSHDRSSNLLKILRPLPFPGVNLTNFANFFFLTAFSGMEFTLTFLAHERFDYTARKNAMMFVFVGLVLAFIQGGFVRRKAHDIGEKRLALAGLLSLIPGMLLIGSAGSIAILYLGLFFMAVGGALIIPCLTALVSLYTPPEAQGRTIGVFRSLGALARVIGPLIACLSYWRFGSSFPYFAGALFFMIPFFLVFKLPQPKIQTA